MAPRSAGGPGRDHRPARPGRSHPRATRRSPASPRRAPAISAQIHAWNVPPRTVPGDRRNAASVPTPLNCIPGAGSTACAAAPALIVRAHKRYLADATIEASQRHRACAASCRARLRSFHAVSVSGCPAPSRRSRASRSDRRGDSLGRPVRLPVGEPRLLQDVAVLRWSCPNLLPAREGRLEQPHCLVQPARRVICGRQVVPGTQCVDMVTTSVQFEVGNERLTERDSLRQAVTKLVKR